MYQIISSTFVPGRKGGSTKPSCLSHGTESHHGKKDVNSLRKKLDNPFDIDLNKSNLISDIQV
jgi:hypothetical protein